MSPAVWSSGTIPKYYAFDASAEKMKHNTQEEN